MCTCHLYRQLGKSPCGTLVLTKAVVWLVFTIQTEYKRATTHANLLWMLTTARMVLCPCLADIDSMVSLRCLDIDRVPIPSRARAEVDTVNRVGSDFLTSA